MEVDAAAASALSTTTEERKMKNSKKRGAEAEEEWDDLGYSFPLDNRSGKLPKWNTWEEKKEAEAKGVDLVRRRMEDTHRRRLAALAAAFADQPDQPEYNSSTR